MGSVLLDLTVVMVLAAGLSWLTTLSRQPIILAYIACGVVVAGFFDMDPSFLEELSRLGVTLLLFLAGLALHPQRLAQLFRHTLVVTLAVCGASGAVAFCLARLWGLGWAASAYVGMALMFSSTILVVKLLPARTLHHDRMGAVCISVLVAEDIIAVAVLMVLEMVGSWRGGGGLKRLTLTVLGGVGLVPAALLLEQFLLRRILRQVHRYQETVYLMVLAWCLGIGAVAEGVGLSCELGAFIAGVALARCAIARALFEGLRVLRDFFLVLFFFALGGRLNLSVLPAVLPAAGTIALALMMIKPLAFRRMFRMVGEGVEFATEAGLRLGQASEFGLIIIALVTLDLKLAPASVNELVTTATLITMTVSSYLVVYRYPTPMGTRGGLQMD